MYIRRDCLDAVGPFDEAAFGRGYGEENDFCLRASHLGWRHVTRLIEGYVPAQTVPRVLVDWVLVLATVTSLLLAFSGILQARPAMTVGLLAVFVVLLLIVLRRTRRETSDDAATPSSGGGT